MFDFWSHGMKIRYLPICDAHNVVNRDSTPPDEGTDNSGGHSAHCASQEKSLS